MSGIAWATVMNSDKRPIPIKTGVHNPQREADKCQLIMTSHTRVVCCKSYTEKIQQEHEGGKDRTLVLSFGSRGD